MQFHCKIILLSLALFCVSCTTAIKKYYLVVERVEAFDVDENYITNLEYSFKRVNKTSYGYSASFDFLKDIEDQVGFVTRAYFLVNNEYRPIAVHLKGMCCAYWKNAAYGLSKDFVKYSNVSGCKMNKGHYYVKNYFPKLDDFPDSMYTNQRLKLTLQYTYKEKTFVGFAIYIHFEELL